jgi:xanthine dehydrogenase large subunit
MTADGGWSLDLMEAVLSGRCVHIDNAYWIPAIEVHGRIARRTRRRTPRSGDSADRRASC